MFIVSEKVKFCTCSVKSTEQLHHYWRLYRFHKDPYDICIGEPLLPLNFLHQNYHTNYDTLLKRLNESDAFDKSIIFKPNDQLEIVINNKAINKQDMMTFCFKYKAGKWVKNDLSYLELYEHYDALAYGNFKQLKKNERSRNQSGTH